MAQYDVPTEVRVREVRARSGEFVDSAVELAGGLARLGLGVLQIPLALLPKETRIHTRNAFKELSYAFATLPRDFADIAGERIEEWARRGEAPATRTAPLDEVEKI
jgi:hypothetical protein